MDYYADRLTLRELMNRLQSLPPEAPIWRVLEEQDARAAERAHIAEVEKTLAMFKPK